jgi:hypothetical protein
MQACPHAQVEPSAAAVALRPARAWRGLASGPICCKREMMEMVRRAILRGDGRVLFCAVWHCLNCGRLLL